MKISKEDLAPFLIFLAVLLVYLLFTTKNYYWDGVEFAGVIENANNVNTSLFHPNHLVYNIFGYVIYKAALFTGIYVRAILVMQIANCILSAISAFVLFKILKESLRSTYVSVVMTLLFAFSVTWWKFSTDADAYIPSCLFLLISFYFILPSKEPKPSVVAITHWIAMCFHQLAIFFFPIVVLGIFLQTKSLVPRERLYLILRYCILAFLLTFGTFYAFFYIQRTSLDFKEFINWITFHSYDSAFTFDAIKNLNLTVQGNIKLFFGGRLTLMKEAMNPLTIALMIAFVFVCIAFMVEFVKRMKGLQFDKEAFRHSLERFKPLLILCAAWVSVYVCFLFFWLPRNTFYRLFYLPALIVVLGALLVSFEGSVPHKRRRLAALFVVIVLLYNFLLYIYPYSHLRKDTPIYLASELNKTWNQGTVVYFGKPSTNMNIFKYFNPKT